MSCQKFSSNIMQRLDKIRGSIWSAHIFQTKATTHTHAPKTVFGDEKLSKKYFACANI